MLPKLVNFFCHLPSGVTGMDDKLVGDMCAPWFWND